MLRYKGIASDEPERCLFRIFEGEEPASVQSLGRVARIAGVLLVENKLDGAFRVAEAGLLALELARSERSFFHNGIVFAALDAVNDPVRNPTLTLSADDTTP